MAIAPHEVPIALRQRPVFVIRTIVTVTIPRRAATILLVGLLAYGGLVALVTAWWLVAALVTLLPAGVLSFVVEARPRGKTVLSWLYVLVRRQQRPPVLIHRRTVVPVPVATRVRRTGGR